MSELLIRVLALYVPILAVSIALQIRRPTKRERSAVLLACLWNMPALAIVHTLALQHGWWTIHGSGGVMLFGMPIELLVGWMLLWGALPVLVAPDLPLSAVVLILFAFDYAIMPRCAPVVRLAPAPTWLIGEAVAIALCLIPAQLFARWTRDDRRLAARATLQVICFGALVLWLVPSALFEHVGRGWSVLYSYDRRSLSIALQLVALSALPGLTAVQEFVTRGGGTPVPFDPPKRLVTTGIYAYIANPMQFSAALTLFTWGLVLRSWWITMSSAMAIIYGAGLAAWDEARDLDARFGAAWRRYRTHVANWRPRWRPYVELHARLYVAFSCGKCSEVGAWLEAQRPCGLQIVPAEQHPTRDLWRMTYDPGDGTREEEGIAALARALEHIHLGWALTGCFLRLPIVRPCVQLIVDASGGGPQRIARRPANNASSYCPR